MILMVQHTVRDYDAWKPVFDEHEGVRVRYGSLGSTVYHDADKPNDVTVLTRFESRDRAEQFTRDLSLREAMERGGVISEPRVTWLEETDSAASAERRAA